MYHDRFGVTALEPDFGELLKRQTSALTSYARRLTRSTADAEDLLQDTMLRCWSARARYRAGSNFAAWSRVVMRNTFLSGLRRARFHADMPDDLLNRLEGREGGQEDAVALGDIEWALDLIHPDQRAAVLLAAEGMPMETAATELAIPQGTFKSRVSRGRAIARRSG